MADILTGSVGRNGKNLTDDVRNVQTLLNLVPVKGLYGVVPTHGVPDWGTQKAIDFFQRQVMGMAVPDGRIDPKGRTIGALYAIATSNTLTNGVLDPSFLRVAAMRGAAAPSPAKRVPHHTVKASQQATQSSKSGNATATNAGQAGLLADLKNPKVWAMLDVIAWAEGAGYKIMFGKRTFSDFSKHPGKVVHASGYSSSAAGRYQFLKGTWAELVQQYGFKDFTPESQDLGGVALLRRRKMIEPLKNDQFETAVHLGCLEWASLPDLDKSNPYKNPRSHYGGQPAKNMGDLKQRYNQYLANPTKRY